MTIHRKVHLDPCIGFVAAFALLWCPLAAAQPGAYAVTPEVRAFLQQAKAADAIEDPLLRCLRYPDLPGQAWPQGLAAQHCDYTFGGKVSLDGVAGMLERSDAAGLEALFRADLERHFAEGDHSEVVHADFAVFDASERADELSRRWLELAPESAFALAARGQYLLRRAWSERGNQLAYATPNASISRMRRTADEAEALVSQALRREPQLLPAMDILIELGHLASKSAWRRRGEKAAAGLDPACSAIVHTMLDARSPLWGGGYPQMFSIIKERERYLPERPLLALSFSVPERVGANDLEVDERFADAVELLTTALARSTHPDIPLQLARLMPKAGLDEPWRRLMYLVAASRFRLGDADAALARGKAIFDIAHDAEWALIPLARAAKLDAGNTLIDYQTALAYAASGKIDDAEAALVRAMRNPKFRANNLLQLSRLLVGAGAYAKAEGYIRQQKQEFPQDPWPYQVETDMLLRQWKQDTPTARRIEASLLRFMALSEGMSYPALTPARAQAQAVLAQVRAFLAAHPEAAGKGENGGGGN